MTSQVGQDISKTVIYKDFKNEYELMSLKAKVNATKNGVTIHFNTFKWSLNYVSMFQN